MHINTQIVARKREILAELLLTKGDQIFGVRLSVMKYHEYVGIFHIIDNRVVQNHPILVPDFRFQQLRCAVMIVAR